MADDRYYLAVISFGFENDGMRTFGFAESAAALSSNALILSRILGCRRKPELSKAFIMSRIIGLPYTGWMR